jgi:hypothetical protein
MTTDERIENLEKGLASARRFNRWLLAAVGLALGVWILAGTFGPATAAAPGAGAAFNEVRATRFVVVDEKGKERAVLWSGGKWGPGLSLLDEKGEDCASLNLLGGVPSLTLIDGLRGVTLNVGQDEMGLFLMDHQKRMERAKLTLGNAGPALTLYDENGKERVALGVMRAAMPRIRLGDAAGKTRGQLAAAADVPALLLYDAAGIPRAEVNVALDVPRLHLRDAGGRPVWQAP